MNVACGQASRVDSGHVADAMGSPADEPCANQVCCSRSRTAGQPSDRSARDHLLALWAPVQGTPWRAARAALGWWCPRSPRERGARGGQFQRQTGGESMSANRRATRSQPAQALQLANRVRRARSLLKARVADGHLAAAEVILTCPSEAAGMPVAQLLASQRGWGEARSRALLARVAVREDKSIGSLTERQRRDVASLLTEQPPAVRARGRTASC